MANQKISLMPTATLPLGLTDTLFVMQQGELRKVEFEDLRDSFWAPRALTATVANATTTPAEATGLTMSLPAGTYNIEGSIIYQSSATGVGIQMYLDAGTPANVSRCSTTWMYLSTGTLAASGIADSAAVAAQLVEGKTQNAIGTASGATAGVDTANVDMHAEIFGILILTAYTTIKLMFNASAVGTVTLQAGSCLIPTPVTA